MDSTHRAALDSAERNGYLRAVRAIGQLVCVPFWWHGVDEAGAYRILDNGTVSFVDTGARKLAVTADHVVAGHLAARERDPTLVCQLGGSTVDLASRVIARDARLDLATIDVSDVLVGPTGGYFHAPPQWPTPPLTEGEVILCCGYPGKAARRA